jgi:hypothetical protein
MADLETATFQRWLADVVFLYGHRVGGAIFHHPHHGGVKIADAVRLKIVGIVRKHVEQMAAKNFIPLGHGCAAIGVVHGDDDEVPVNHQIGVWAGGEKHTEIGRRLSQRILLHDGHGRVIQLCV